LLIDTHAHLYYSDLKSQLDDVISRAGEAGVEQIICVGTDLDSSRESITIAEKYLNVFATAGVHPHDAKDAPTHFAEELRKLAGHEKVVAIGEMGLDFFRNLSPPDVQSVVFRQQLELANELNLPAVIHNREADEALLTALREITPKRGVVHCFSSNVETAKAVLELGLKISFTGTVTFGKNHNESVLKAIDLGDFMLETDCPFLAPVPNRGKLNEPGNISHIAQRIAEIKGVLIKEVAEKTTRTAQQFFRLPA